MERLKISKLLIIGLSILVIMSCGYTIDDSISYISTANLSDSDLESVTDGASGQQMARQSRLDRIREQGYFTAGVRGAHNPFGFVDENGKNAGFEVELLEYIAERLGVEARFRVIEFRDAIPFTRDGVVDVVCAIITHRADREEEVDFSVTYYMDSERFLVRTDSGITSIEDLRKPGRRVAAVSGDSVSATLGRLYPDIELYLVSETPEQYDALAQGLVDATAGDSAFLFLRRLTFFDNPNDYRVVGEPLSFSPFGMLVPKNESDWRDFVNLSLNEMFKTGKWDEVYERWFGEKSVWRPEIWP